MTDPKPFTRPHAPAALVASYHLSSDRVAINPTGADVLDALPECVRITMLQPAQHIGGCIKRHFLRHAAHATALIRRGGNILLKACSNTISGFLLRCGASAIALQKLTGTKEARPVPGSVVRAMVYSEMRPIVMPFTDAVKSYFVDFAADLGRFPSSFHTPTHRPHI